MQETPQVCEQKPPAPSPREALIFRMRWLLLPFIMALVCCIAFPCYEFVRDLISLCRSAIEGNDNLAVPILNLLDKFMVGTLLLTTSVGSYHIYLRPIDKSLCWLPTWLRGIDAKELKIVTCLSLAGVSMIGLLKDFQQGIGWDLLSTRLAIHFTFIVSAICIALISRWHHNKGAMEHPENTCTPASSEPAIFVGRWLLFPFVVGLVALIVPVGFEFARGLLELFRMALSGTDELSVPIVDLLDKFMVATLLLTTAVGSYHIYLRPIDTSFCTLPPWLLDLNAEELKIGTCLSLANVTMIGLLGDFHRNVGWVSLSAHLAIHFTFILSGMAVMVILMIRKHPREAMAEH